MTKEEAKDYIKEWCPYDRQEEIIKALEQQPCEDCIGREAMWKVVHECETHNSPSWVWREMLSQLPSVQPTRPTGKWVYKMQVMNNPYTYQCSVCKGWERDKTKYCPNCGAKMVEPQESENKE